MLEGTDLMSAYQTISNSNTDYYSKEGEVISEPVAQKQPAQVAQPAQSQRNEDIGLFNKQYETEQKLNVLVAELKKKKAQEAGANASAAAPEQPSYFDKLFGKKKELYKILQLSLIITLGMSLHFLIDFYLIKYLADNDMSFERQLLLRLLYPLAVIFVVWNLRVFVK
jgi:hypothetical protein